MSNNLNHGKLVVDQDVDDQDVDGQDDDYDSGLSLEIDGTHRFHTKTIPVLSVLGHIKRGDYDLVPPWQREFVWSEARQSELPPLFVW